MKYLIYIMSQKAIDKYFLKAQKEKTPASDTDSDDSIDNFIDNYKSADVAYIEDILKKQNKFKENAKVAVQDTGKSECWKYFGHLYIKNKLILEQFKFCKLCLEKEDMALKRLVSSNFFNLNCILIILFISFSKTTSTTNYNAHLRITHNIDFKAINYNKQFEKTRSALNPSCSKQDKFVTARQIAEMCCWDLESFNIVERPGFQKLLKSLNPRVNLPSNRTIATTALEDVYNVYKTKVMGLISESPKNVTLVLDMWSDKFKRLSYINIKIHFCDDFKLKVISLKTEIFPRPHTGVAVAEKISVSLAEFNLLEKNICAVTDGGKNIISALNIKNISRYGCCAHALHRFLSHDVLNNDEFTHINEITTKLKNIFRSLMYSADEIKKLQNLEEQDKLLEELEIIVNAMECDEGYPTSDTNFSDDLLKVNHLPSLKNSVPTRWNSLLTMFNSYIENKNIINMALINVNKEHLLIPEMQKAVIKEFSIFLKIFEEATQYLQGQQYPTISCCIYFYEAIIVLLEKTEKESSFDLTIKLCHFAKENFYKRFKIAKIHVVAALMDPSQKDWQVLDKYLKKIPKSAVLSFEIEHNVDYPISKEEIIMQEIKNMQLSNDDVVQIEEPQKKSRYNFFQRIYNMYLIFFFLESVHFSSKVVGLYGNIVF